MSHSVIDIGNGAPAADGSDAAEFPLLTVLVLGGRPMDNAGMRALVSAAEGMRAVDEMSLATQIDGSDFKRPDVVLLAIDIDDGGADALINAALAQWKPAPILVVASDFDREQAVQLVCAGARGVIDKEQGSHHLAKAIRKVQRGELWLDRVSLSFLVDELACHARRPRPVTARLGLLTVREGEVVTLVTRGLSNKAIARSLNISDNTVRHHLTSIFEKLGVSDRLGLACYAIHVEGPLLRAAAPGLAG